MTVANAELDCALLSEFRDGDDFALYQFADRHFDDTCAYVCRYMKGNFIEDAEEAVNLAIADVAEDVSEGTEIINPAGYVRRLARNKAQKLMRDRERVKRKPPQRIDLSDVEPHLHTERIRQSVGDALEVLSDDERVVIQSIYYDGRSLRETADWLGCSLNNVRNSHDSAKQKLRAQLADDFE
jgi:RNA polymerase sigma factor (sigma-70 family)